MTNRPAVTVTGLRKRFAGSSVPAAVDGLDFEIDHGEVLVLLGPSGCGKTTTLRCLAGLEDADEGQIRLGDAVVFDSPSRVAVPPERRSVGMVFQSYALWPHMSIRRNIEYPLKARHRKDLMSAGAVEEIARTVECEALLDRYPSQLSGGQQQRVALARGLVARPDLVLFDEPLSNLDARLRELVRAELHRLHRQLGFTAVYVTHDQSEAMALGDRVAVMRLGRIEQIDSPNAVFEHPATDFVAEFVGMSNRLVVRQDGTGVCAGQVPLHGVQFDGPARSDEVAVRLRPASVELFRSSALPDEGYVWCDAAFVDATYAGTERDVLVEVGDTTVRSKVTVDDRSIWVDELQAGEPVRVAFRAGSVNLFNVGTGARDTVSSVRCCALEDVRGPR